MAEAVRSPLCPDDFCPATLPAEPPSSLALDALRKPGTELWLIRTPADFSPASFNGCKVPLVGFQTLKSHRNEAGIRQRYHILSSTSRASPETLLAPSSSAAGQLVPAPALQGTLSIIEIPRSKSSGQCLHAIPTSPPPQIPLGLRPRFQAFGGRQPVPLATVAGEAGDVKHPQKRKKSELVSLNPSPQKVLNGGGLNSASGQGIPEPREQGQIKIEEAVAAPSPAKKKKKKKKKKELGGEMLEPAGEMAEPMEQEQIKIEEAVATPSPAKKKKKKKKKEEELEGEMSEPAGEMSEPTKQEQIKIEEAVAAPSPAKKKKEELEGEMSEPAGEMLEPMEQEQIKIEGTVATPFSVKKKKTKELEGEALESAGEMSEPTEQGQIKIEGTAAAPSPAKKKRKKKKKEVEGEAPEPAGQGPEPEGRAMELQQEAVLSPTKTKKSKKRRGPEGEVQTDLREEKSGKRQEVGGEMPVPERVAELEEEEIVTPVPAKRKRGEPGGERVEAAEMVEALGNAEPSHTKKKRRRKLEGGEGPPPGPPKKSLAGVSESESPSPIPGLEEMKKQQHQEKVGPAEA